jgi:2-polyprenyl-3-methyl-5-hydroxy-6-metoxy-1,4-benzoquinol methylase
MKTSPFHTREALEFNEVMGGFLKSFISDFTRQENITTALEAGCGGSGFFSKILKELGLDVTSFDGRPENVAEVG